MEEILENEDKTLLKYLEDEYDSSVEQKPKMNIKSIIVNITKPFPLITYASGQLMKIYDTVINKSALKQP